ncbi:MAG: hypothetical protein ACRD1R_19435 [Acidobacteriota bacterium]
MKEKEDADRIFHRQVDQLGKVLPDLGKSLALDSKALETHARGRKDPKESSDREADWGRKKKQGTAVCGRKSALGSATSCTWWWTAAMSCRWDFSSPGLRFLTAPSYCLWCKA